MTLPALPNPAIRLILANACGLAVRVNAQALMATRYAEQHNAGAAAVHISDAAELSRILIEELSRVKDGIGGES